MKTETLTRGIRNGSILKCNDQSDSNRRYLIEKSSIEFNGETIPKLFCTKHMRFCRDCELMIQKGTVQENEFAHFGMIKIYENRNSDSRNRKRIYTEVSCLRSSTNARCACLSIHFQFQLRNQAISIPVSTGLTIENAIQPEITSEENVAQRRWYLYKHWVCFWEPQLYAIERC